MKRCKGTTKRRSGRGALILIFTLLVSSAGLRIALGTGAALAGASESTHPVAPSLPEPAGQVDTDRAQASRLLVALQEREARAAERERQMEIRSKALAVANAEIETRLAALEAAETALRETLALANGAAEEDLARLTSVYESMKPKDAAALFATMEPDFAAGFLARMRPDAAAALMAGLPPDVAYSISVILAGRNARVPKS